MSELHQALIRGDIYPDATDRVDYIETHISRLYLTDKRVYKIKKPVDFGFCNFTSLDRRRFYCEEEVRLNRRLASESYLGVSKIVRQGKTFAIDRPGEIYEYAVCMRRLPQKRMLDRLLATTDPQEPLISEVETIGRLLARFHTGALPITKENHNDPRMVLLNWQQNFTQTRDCPAELIQANSFRILERLILDFIKMHSELFERRQQEGYIRDGHGDLHSEHICLTEPIQIFDCIEFNPELRYGDILSDLAFLIMDLELHQRTDLAQRLYRSYREKIKTGPQTQSLLRFYCLYRAWVRAKVHYFQMALPAGYAAHFMAAHNYFHLASSYALPQILLLCCGLIGSGKTTLAQDLGAALRAEVISSDLLRPAPKNNQSAKAAYGQGRYSPKKRLANYHKIAEQVRSKIHRGETLIIDATFENSQMRAPFLDLAKQAGIPCCFIQAECTIDLIRTRLRQRAKKPQLGGGSEARLQHFEQQRKNFEPLSLELLQVHVDTGHPREYNVDSLLEKLLQACGTLR